MMKDMIIAMLMARVSMIYIFTEYAPVEATWVFWLLTILSFIVILMIEDKAQRIRQRGRKRNG